MDKSEKALFAMLASVVILILFSVYSITTLGNDYKQSCEQIGGKAVHNGSHYECLGSVQVNHVAVGK